MAPLNVYKIATKFKDLLSKDEQLLLYEKFALLKKILLENNLPIDNKGVKELSRNHPEYKLIIKEGREALDKLVLQNTRQILNIAKQFEGSADVDDLFHWGTTGLIHAITNKYNLDKKNPFGESTNPSALAYFWIRVSMSEGIRKSQGIVVPQKKQKEYQYQFKSITNLPGDQSKDIFEVVNNDTVRRSSIVDEVLSTLSDQDIEFLKYKFQITDYKAGDLEYMLWFGYSFEEAEARLQRIFSIIRDEFGEC